MNGLCETIFHLDKQLYDFNSTILIKFCPMV